MNIYITYDRYERDEFYSIYRIETNRDRAIQYYKQVDLVDFISYGPDDCHSFQLQRVVMTREQYKELRRLFQEDAYNKELIEFMIGIFDETEFEVETISSTDGCSDVFDTIRYYCEQNGLNYEDDEEQWEAQEKLMNDEELFQSVLREYIECMY